MLGCGRGGKPKSGFPPRPRALGNRQRRAIPTFPPPRRRSRLEKWKSKSRIPTFPPARFPTFKPKKGGLAADRSAPAFRLILRENRNRRSGSFFDENMLPIPVPSGPDHSCLCFTGQTVPRSRARMPVVCRQECLAECLCHSSGDIARVTKGPMSRSRWLPAVHGNAPAWRHTRPCRKPGSVRDRPSWHVRSSQ